jgi:iron complex outermembrane receptor protein
MLTNSINNNDIERVDVVMGPSSALYGANASGGVVNIITRQGVKGMEATVSYGYGSNNTNRPHASIGNVVSKGDNRFHYYFSYSGDYSDGYKNTPIASTLDIYSKGPGFLTTATAEDADYSSTYFAGKVGWVGGTGANLTVAYNYANLNVNGGQPNLIPVDSGKQGVGSLRLQVPIKDIMKVTFTLGQQYWDRPAKTNYGISKTTSGLVYNYNRRYSQESKVTRLPVELQSDFNLGKNNILTAGAFYSKEKISSDRNNWVTGAGISESDYKTDQTAFYLQDQTFFFDKRLSIIAGIRYDSWKYYDIYDSASTQQHPEDFSNNTFTYRGGVKYQINNELAIRSSAGTAFYPGLATWYFQNINTGSTRREPNPNLKPEKTWMVDLGLEGKYDSTGTSFSVTPYYGRITDMVSGRYDPHPTLPGVQIIRYSNVGEAEIYGVETQASQRITDHLSAFANLTLNHSYITEDPSNKGNQVTHAPNYTGSIGIKYADPKLFSGTLTFRASDSMFYDSENTRLPYYHMDPYQTLDGKVWRDWKLTDRLTLRTALTVENIFDKEFSPEFIYANPGRTIQGVAGLNYSF